MFTGKQNTNYLLGQGGYYLLGKGGYIFGSVGLSVCLWAILLKKLRRDWDEILWRGPGQ